MSETTSSNDVPVLRRAAMDYLARREHSVFELAQKLCKKFPDVNKTLLNDVLEVLKSEGLQSDERFAESYVRHRKSKGFAYLHIKAGLSKRRVSDNVFGKYLVLDDKNWQQSANSLVVKKLHNEELLKFGSKLHRKLSRFLESRGFSAVEVKKALESHISA